MRRIPSSQAKAGMILAEPIVNQVGAPILNPGACLSSAVLDRLAREGIAELSIEEDGVAPSSSGSDAESAAEIEAITRAVRQSLDHRFQRHQRNPLMLELKSLAEKHLIQVKCSKLT